jgi:hypothetical protein
MVEGAAANSVIVIVAAPHRLSAVPLPRFAGEEDD